MPPSMATMFFAMDVGGVFELAWAAMLILVFSFLLVDLFDTAGTLIGLAHQGRHAGRERQPAEARTRADRGFDGDALGTSTTTSYIESAAGIKAGGSRSRPCITSRFRWRGKTRRVQGRV